MNPMISRTLRVLRGQPLPGHWDRAHYRRIVALRLIARHIERKAP